METASFWEGYTLLVQLLLLCWCSLEQDFSTTLEPLVEDMKNLIIITLFAFAYTQSYGQLKDVDIIWGQPYKSKKTVVTDIITSENGDIYAIKKNFGMFNQEVYLEKYRNLEPYQSSQIEFSKEERYDVMKNVISLDNDLWMLEFKSNYDKTSLHAQFVDKNNLNPIGERVEIFDLDVQRRLRYSYGGFDHSINRSNNNIGFFTQYPGKDNEIAKLGFQCFDRDFYPVWEHDVDLPFTKEMVEIISFDLSNELVGYGVIKVYDKKKSKRDKNKGEYTYHLVRCDASGKSTVQQLSLEEGKTMHRIHFEVSADGSLYFGGFFGNTCCSIDGSFFIKMDGATGKIHSMSAKEFSLNFVKQGLSQKQQQKLEDKYEGGDQIGFDNVDFKDFIIRKDGGVVLVGEFYAMNLNGNQDLATPENASHFNYKDIMVVSISKEGEIEWSRKILKRQLTTDDGGFMSSFVLAVNNDKLHFVFNDHEKNLHAKKVADLSTYDRSDKTSVLTMVSVDPEGNLTREKIISQEELGLEIRPQSCAQVSENELILFGFKKNENQFAKVVFN